MHPWVMSSSDVPSCRATTSHNEYTSFSSAQRLGTASPSPSTWVDDREVDNPIPPAASERSSSALISVTSAAVDGRAKSSPST